MNCFVEIDLVQAEWVVTAFCARDERMLQVVFDELDPHLRTGSLISGAPEEFVKVDHDLVGHATDPDTIAELRKARLPKTWDLGKKGRLPIDVFKHFYLPRTMSIRQMGKKSNHGLNYNEQYKTFALTNEIEEKEAKFIIHAYRDVAYPGLKTYYAEVEAELRQNNCKLSNCFGQTRQFLDRWDQNLLNAAFAFKPQSTVGNITNKGWRGIFYDTAKVMRRVHIAAQVHDSVLTHHTFDTFSELEVQIMLCNEHMATPFSYHQREYTLRREVKIGCNWGESAMITVPSVSAEALKEAWDLSLGYAASEEIR